MRSWRLACAFVLLLLPAVTLASTRYDPRLRFRTISTPRFDIHYHQGEEAQAKRLAAIAESVAAELDASLGAATGRVQVILVAQSDLSNGWATPLPYNTIEITAAAPAADSVIGNTSDWLRMVFTHEYTHIVHLSRGRGWIGGLRRAFGRNPLLFPNLYLPIWQVEGLAVYEESALTTGGRIADSSFRAILDVAAGASRFEPLDRVSGGLVDWPGGNAPYLYGAFFHRHLAQKYGDASMRQLTDDTAGRIPYFGSLAYRRVFGQPLGALWRDYESTSPRQLREISPTTVRLTRHGFRVISPRFGPDGRLYYSIVNPHGFPALMAIDAAGGTPVRIRDRFLGSGFGFAGSRIVFDQIEIESHVGEQSDLYIADLQGGRARRLTRGLRAGSPDVSPDGSTIVCTIQETDRRSLITLPLSPDGSVGAPRVLISEAGVSVDNPRWSPSPLQIVAAQRGRDLIVVDAPSRRVLHTISAANGARLVHPYWVDRRMLLFASDRGGLGFEVHQLDVDTGMVWVLGGTGPDARFPLASPKRDRLTFVGYSAEGYDLYSRPLDLNSVPRPESNAEWRSLFEERAFRWTQLAPSLSPSAPPTTETDGSTRYSPWRTIAPRYWTPVVATDSEELFIGAATGSSDALGRHAYAVQAAWTTARARPDWQTAYVYDRWWPTIFGNMSDDTDPWRGGEIRTREGNAGILLPFRRIRRSQSILAALHASTDELICGPCVPQTVDRRAARAGWRVSSARGYGYSISLEDGWSATTTAEFTREAWGSKGDGGAVTFDVRGYLPLRPRHAVVAVRGAGAATWGGDEVRRIYSASGSATQPGGFRLSSDAIGLIRGVEEDEIFGQRAAVVNVDYRVPLRRIDRGWGTLPFFARVVHGAVFADVGHAWNGRFRAAEATTSLGAELSLDAVIGFHLPLTMTAGAAWVSHDRGFTVFGRIGRAF